MELWSGPWIEWGGLPRSNAPNQLEPDKGFEWILLFLGWAWVDTLQEYNKYLGSGFAAFANFDPVTRPKLPHWTVTHQLTRMQPAFLTSELEFLLKFLTWLISGSGSPDMTNLSHRTVTHQAKNLTPTYLFGVQLTLQISGWLTKKCDWGWELRRDACNHLSHPTFSPYASISYLQVAVATNWEG